MNSSTTIILVIFLMVVSMWSIESPLGYFVLCEFAVGRLIVLLSVIMLTRINPLYGVLSVLLYMCLQLCYFIDEKYKYQTSYIDAYYTTMLNPDILAHNSREPIQEILASKDYRIPISRTNHGLFECNKQLMDDKINYENVSSRNPLNKILANDNNPLFWKSHSNTKHKLSPYNDEDVFTDLNADFINPTNAYA